MWKSITEYFGGGFAHEKKNLISILHIIVSLCLMKHYVAKSFNVRVWWGLDNVPSSFCPQHHKFPQQLCLVGKVLSHSLFTKRMHCPFSSHLAGSTSRVCFKALVWQHSELWKSLPLISQWDEKKAHESEQETVSLTLLYYGSRFGVLMPIQCLLVFRVKTAVHWASCVWIVVAHIYIGSANRKVKCFNNPHEIWTVLTNTLIYWIF